jgi:hypothetical protein
MIESWHRNALNTNETKKAHDAFKIYLGTEVTPGVRVLEDVARKLGKSCTNVDRWAAKHRWYERARDFDSHCQSKEEEQIGDIVAKWRKRRLEDAERAYQTVQKIQSTIQEMFEWPIVEQRPVVTARDANGNAVAITNIVPARWRFRDIAAMLNMTMEAMDKAYGIVAGAEAADKPISDDDIAESEDASVGLAAALAAIEQRRRGLPGVNGNGKH